MKRLLEFCEQHIASVANFCSKKKWVTLDLLGLQLRAIKKIHNITNFSNVLLELVNVACCNHKQAKIS